MRGQRINLFIYQSQNPCPGDSLSNMYTNLLTLFHLYCYQDNASHQCGSENSTSQPDRVILLLKNLMMFLCSVSLTIKPTFLHMLSNLFQGLTSACFSDQIIYLLYLFIIIELQPFLVFLTYTMLIPNVESRNYLTPPTWESFIQISDA